VNAADAAKKPNPHPGYQMVRGWGFVFRFVELPGIEPGSMEVS